MNEITVTKGEATRSRIVEAAYQLFMAQGFHATTMRQIVEKAGITMGGIYTHFASKEAIWEAVFMANHPYREILALLTQAGGDTIGDFLKDMASLLVGGLGQRPDLLNLLFIELVEFDGKHLSIVYSQALPEMTRLGQIFAQKKGKLRPYPYPSWCVLSPGYFSPITSPSRSCRLKSVPSWAITPWRLLSTFTCTASWPSRRNR